MIIKVGVIDLYVELMIKDFRIAYRPFLRKYLGIFARKTDTQLLSFLPPIHFLTVFLTSPLDKTRSGIF